MPCYVYLAFVSLTIHVICSESALLRIHAHAGDSLMSPPEEADLFRDILVDDTPLSSLLEPLEEAEPSCESLELFLSDQVPPVSSQKATRMCYGWKEGTQLSDKRVSCDFGDLPTAQEATKERERARHRRNQKACRDRLKVCKLTCCIC